MKNINSYKELNSKQLQSLTGRKKQKHKFNDGTQCIECLYKIFKVIWEAEIGGK